jgi:hypothetical protein
VVDANSSGRVAPRIKSIDVRANLLSQRLAERKTLYHASRSRLLMIAGILLSGGLLLPWLYQVQARATKAASAILAERGKLQKEVTELQSLADEVEPKVRQAGMVSKCMTRSERFMNEFITVMNAISPEVALNNVKGEVLGGEVKLTARADAETFPAVKSYLQRAAQGANPKDTGVTSTKRSDALRKGGISFEFTKKVRIGS